MDKPRITCYKTDGSKRLDSVLGIDGRGLDGTIKSLSVPSRFFCADIPDFDSYGGNGSGYSSKYVLMAGVNTKTDYWGVLLLAYPLPSHKDIIDRYLRRVSAYADDGATADVRVLGGGKIDLSVNKATKTLAIRVYDKSYDYGPVLSKLAVRTCLHSYFAIDSDHCGIWSIGDGKIIYDINK